MTIEREYKADIIIMREEENGEYRFYLCDRFNDMKATQEAIEQLAERHNARISWFPTADPNIAKIRKLFHVTDAEKELLQQTVDILKRRQKRNESDQTDQT